MVVIDCAYSFAENTSCTKREMRRKKKYIHYVQRKRCKTLYNFVENKWRVSQNTRCTKGRGTQDTYLVDMDVGVKKSFESFGKKWNKILPRNIISILTHAISLVKIWLYVAYEKEKTKICISLYSTNRIISLICTFYFFVGYIQSYIFPWELTWVNIKKICTYKNLFKILKNF
jgi:hypothetical protein